MDFGDAVRVYFRARARRGAHAELSNEDFEEGKCGLLKKATRGTCDAGQNWELVHAMTMEAGFRQRSFSARVLYREKKNVKVRWCRTETTSRRLDRAKV